MKKGDRIKIIYEPPSSVSADPIIIPAAVLEVIDEEKILVNTATQKGIIVSTRRSEFYRIEPYDNA